MRWSASAFVLAMTIGTVVLPVSAGETLPVEVDPALEERLERAGPGARVKAWVLVREDKGFSSEAALREALAALERTYDPHALRRRALRRTRPGLFDVQDLPLPGAWVAAVRDTGAEVVVESRWAPGMCA